jgi:hypothetical protein
MPSTSTGRDRAARLVVRVATIFMRVVPSADEIRRFTISTRAAIDALRPAAPG